MVKYFNQAKFNDFVIKSGIIGFFKEPIKLKSGRMSNWYVNWRNVSEDVGGIDKLSDFVTGFIKAHKLKPDCIYGVPEGATKLGIITQYKWTKMQPDYSEKKYVLPMGRGKIKGHGDPKDRYFVGVPSGNVVVLEDVTTTGGSLINTLKSLMLLRGVKVIAAIGLTNRNKVRDDGKSVGGAIAEIGAKYYSMSNASELLPLLIKTTKTD
ncbi:MAG: hypothetical protein CVU81_01395 [Euryarchaeota archaeon HGW-Euryarchaeota-1]|nr:MAG: hypothetical protein CVU81_01395 [Euryarchaeota archaeon HGW-Euryarchaeota-1]